MVFKLYQYDEREERYDEQGELMTEFRLVKGDFIVMEGIYYEVLKVVVDKSNNLALIEETDEPFRGIL